MALYSAHLDETGTGGESPYTVVGGAVATAAQWGKLESAWRNLLARSRVSAYHWKEFNYPKDSVFGRWSDLKRKRFVEAQEKIINKNTIIRVSVGLESAVHADIKRRMKGVSGFSAESSYSLCLRYLMVAICDQLVKVDPDCRLSILVEDGPWAAGAMKTYQRVSAMTGRWKPARHAHRLAGFASARKGELSSLEAADYLVGEEHAMMIAGSKRRRGTQVLSMLLTEEHLERWYEGMIKEKENRRKHHRESKGSPE